MTQQRDVVVIGGGQAGLAASYHLTAADLDHVVLELDRVGDDAEHAVDHLVGRTPESP